ncbi:hypothetical protein DOTSEDRAFT_137952 [Dothistroma septosporum NZE10]|uniref:YTH domain-containing protein n=1 Tax=Dothistroma septosporum (strain NZE10 / CBS 128990) TaxID=675120 RepID=N1PF88_DOTSN|nr:hypothetical protein DOTSEDRAFT_137952 [Dothistroma septosporum NZE10]
MPISPPSPSLARGPPRKPKRSGHAVWVGNIPRGASIEALKDHFSSQATKDIESVFLMAKSNCAFVNYDTEEACVSAVERFNYSLFGAVRLLCRMRREPGAQRETSSRSRTSSHSDSPVSSVREDSSQTSSSQTSSSFGSLTSDLNGLGIQHEGDTKTEIVPAAETAEPVSPPARLTDRYFIVKSLTKEDLQNSLQTGTWETQPHNQRGFDDAFREAENVYMIFSVNKSGEYFGYARMISSPLTRSSPQDIVSASTTPAKQSDTLKITQTAATATAPAGVIIDDTVRGTLFWEAQHEDNGIVSSTLTALDRAEQSGHIRSRPFQVEWLSVRRVTFQRTKGIRNPWNNNKEVKVARDGTELETDVGSKIVGLFHETYEETMKGT